jgi:hypothetical protein
MMAYTTNPLEFHVTLHRDIHFFPMHDSRLASHRQAIGKL